MAEAIVTHPVPSPEKKSHVFRNVLIVLAVLFVIGWIGNLVDPQGSSVPSSSSSATSSLPATRSTPTAEESIEAVGLDRLLSDYKDNEVAADGRYKGRRIQVTGVVGDIKKDILDSPYVTLGHGERFEIPEVQCMLANSMTSKAMQLTKGQMLTMEGKVSGLMMNVLLRNCTF